jgi:hypothetical protein
MDKKQLIKCNKALRQVEQLDSEIINIEKIAMLVSDGKFESSFELKIRDLSRKDKEKQESLFDKDRSLKSGNIPYEISLPLSFFCMGLPYQQKTQEQEGKKFDFILNPALSESLILRILGLMLTELQQERETLLNELQKHGIKV